MLRCSPFLFLSKDTSYSSLRKLVHGPLTLRCPAIALQLVFFNGELVVVGDFFTRLDGSTGKDDDMSRLIGGLILSIHSSRDRSRRRVLIGAGNNFCISIRFTAMIHEPIEGWEREERVELPRHPSTSRGINNVIFVQTEEVATSNTFLVVSLFTDIGNDLTNFFTNILNHH